MQLARGLFPYQQEAVEQLVRHHAVRQRILLVLPTGGGKTLTAATYVTTQFLRAGKRVVWIAHTEELLDQAFETFANVLGSDALLCRRYGAHDDSKRRRDAQLWFVNNLVTTRPARCDLLVIDEAHHAGASTYKQWMSTYHCQTNDGAKVLGLTATPYRMIKGRPEPLTALTFGRPAVQLFESVAFERTFNDLVAEDRLVPFQHHRLETRLSFSLQIRDGEVSPDSLSQLDTVARNEAIASYWHRRRATFGTTLIFAANAEHARNLARAIGPDANWVLSGGAAERARRDEAISDFRSGRLPVLVNVGIFREGVDVPRIQTVLLARPTASPGLFTQMVGRGARKHPGKTHFHLVDVHDQLGEFEEFLCGVEVLRSSDLGVEKTVAQRTLIAVNIASAALADVTDDGRLLLDAVLALRAGRLAEYAGWMSFTAGSDPSGIGVLLRKPNFDVLRTLADRDGTVQPGAAHRAFELEAQVRSRSLWRCARILSQGYTGRLRAFSTTTDDGLVSLVSMAHQIVRARGDAQLDACARAVQTLEDHGWRWRLGERELAVLARAYVVEPDKYAAALVYQDHAGAPRMRLLTAASYTVLRSIAQAGGAGRDHVRARLASELTPLEPDLAVDAPWLIDHIVDQTPSWAELVVEF